MEVTYTSLTITSLYSKRIYKQLTLIAVYRTNLLATNYDFYLALALYLVNTTYKDKAITNVLWEPLLSYN